jgi:hypothetical protein
MFGIFYSRTKIEATIEIPFRTIPRKRNMLGIPLRVTKIGAISPNSVPKHCEEEKMTEKSFCLAILVVS